MSPGIKMEVVSSPIAYEEAHIALLAALPELQPAYDEMLADWDNFGGGPPGQYILFSDLLETWIEVLVRIAPGARGRNEALGRAMEFGESLLASTDVETRSLGRDAFVSPFVPPWVGRQRSRSVANI
jgi:hypothetical protein